MEILKAIGKFLFNENTGYFLLQHSYNYKGKPSIGWTLNRGYRVFGISGYTRIGYYHDLEEARQDLKTVQS